MWSDVIAEHGTTISAFVVGTIVALVNKLWNRASEKTKARVTSTVDVARSVMAQVVLTADPAMTIPRLIIQLKGAAAIQIARLPESVRPLATAFVPELIASAVHTYVSMHPNPQTLTLPVLKGSP